MDTAKTIFVEQLYQYVQEALSLSVVIEEVRSNIKESEINDVVLRVRFRLFRSQFESLGVKTVDLADTLLSHPSCNERRTVEILNELKKDLSRNQCPRIEDFLSELKYWSKRVAVKLQEFQEMAESLVTMIVEATNSGAFLEEAGENRAAHIGTSLATGATIVGALTVFTVGAPTSPLILAGTSIALGVGALSQLRFIEDGKTSGHPFPFKTRKDLQAIKEKLDKIIESSHQLNNIVAEATLNGHGLFEIEASSRTVLCTRNQFEDIFRVFKENDIILNEKKESTRSRLFCCH